MARTRPARSRKAPQRYSPEGGPLDDDYAADQHDDVALEDLSESDVTSIASIDDNTDDDLEGFVVDDDAPVSVEETDDDDEEDEWDSDDDEADEDDEPDEAEAESESGSEYDGTDETESEDDD